MMTKPLILIITFLLFLISIGCSKEKVTKTEEIKKPLPSEKAKSEQIKEEPNSESLITTYHYNPAGKVDPFQPLIIEEPKTPEKSAARKLGSVPPLLRYELDQLKLVGIIANIKPPRGLIEDVTGDGYIVVPGDRIGRNEGVIKEIKENEIIIEEKQLDAFGKLIKKQNILRLHQPEELEEK